MRCELKLSLPSLYGSFSHQVVTDHLSAQKLSDTLLLLTLKRTKKKKKMLQGSRFPNFCWTRNYGRELRFHPKTSCRIQTHSSPPPSHPKLGQRGSGYAWAHFSEQRMGNSCVAVAWASWNISSWVSTVKERRSLPALFCCISAAEICCFEHRKLSCHLNMSQSKVFTVWACFDFL